MQTMQRILASTFKEYVETLSPFFLHSSIFLHFLAAFSARRKLPKEDKGSQTQMHKGLSLFLFLFVYSLGNAANCI